MNHAREDITCVHYYRFSTQAQRGTYQGACVLCGRPATRPTAPAKVRPPKITKAARFNTYSKLNTFGRIGS